jgi:hypothetical protein
MWVTCDASVVSAQTLGSAISLSQVSAGQSAINLDRYGLIAVGQWASGDSYQLGFFDPGAVVSQVESGTPSVYPAVMVEGFSTSATAESQLSAITEATGAVVAVEVS